MDYPETRTADQVDELHGVRVADPYRWLEDLDSEETRDWIAAQNRLTFSYLEGFTQRGEIRERLEAIWNYERIGLPHKRGGRYFLGRNDGLQNQNVLCVTESLDEEPRPLLDPNALSEEGTVALISFAVSEDGQHLAYGLAAAGSDWQEWRVRDVETGEDLEDHVRWVKFSGASWATDGSGFYYSRYDEPVEGTELKEANRNHKLCFHRLGTAQSDDEVVYERPDQPQWLFGGRVSEDGEYLIVAAMRGTDRNNAIFVRRAAGGEFIELLPDFDAQYAFVDNDGPVLYFRSDLDAARGRLIAVDLDAPGEVREVIAETADRLQEVGSVGGKFIALRLHDAHNTAEVHSRSGEPKGEIELPGIGTVAGFDGHRDDPETFFVFTGFAEPFAIHRHDVSTGETTLVSRPDTDFDPDEFTTEQVFVESRDGTRVPMFLSYRQDVRPNGDLPILLTGYGGFDISLTPAFSARNVAWMERGGVLAVANLRGGGEYGKDWHEGGMKANKQNVFDDFIATAEWLIAEGWTRKGRIAIAGGSNGGLLVGACLVQRPDLWGACLPGVGVLDMLRFHKFTIGWAWISDYGSPDDRDEFATLHAYSPYHNLEEGKSYPPTLVHTGDHDDRVFPGHSFKFAARLQACQGGPAPALIRVDVRAGHGLGKPTSKLIEEATDVLTFAESALT